MKNLFLALLLTLSCGAMAAETSRPNILFLLADDWAWPHASCLGYPAIKTPAFDRLAREGVLFRNAHAAAPSCSPSRASILTGQWPWRLEQGANLWGVLPAKFQVYPDLLEKAGYFVGLTGKGYGPGSDEGRPHNAAGASFKNFDAFLAARPKGKPFCFWFGSGQPHRGYQPGSGERAGVDSAKVIVPPYLPDNETTRKDICDYLFQVEGFDADCAAILAALEKTGELDNTIIVCSGDNGWPFPRSKATCYDTGTHQPLAIRWGARVQGGRTVDDYVSLVDLAPTFLEAAGQPVPPVMTGKSLLPVLLSAKSGQVDATRDHTLTGMERHARAGRIDGEQTNVGYPMRSLLTKDFHYIRNFKPDRWPAGNPPEGPLPSFEKIAANTFVAFPDCDAGLTKAFLLEHRDEPAIQPFANRAFGKRPAQELYDLRADPFELNNVATNPAYADTLKALDARLQAELKATDDPRVNGGGDAFDTYPMFRPNKHTKPEKSKATANSHPNILLILADDLGYGDVGCYNDQAKVATPNVDRLAREGMRFTDAHSPAAVCTPARYSLMTGQMAFRVPHGDRIFTGVGGPSLIAPGRLTLPEMLREQGYRTAAVGKWHIGLTFFDKAGEPVRTNGLTAVRCVDFSRRIEGGPLDHGFDSFFGTACCPGTDWLYAFIEGDRVPVPPTSVINRTILPHHYYSEDCRDGLIAINYSLEDLDLVFLERSKKFLEEHVRQAPDQPFFLYHATAAVHLPSFAAKQFQGASKAGPHGDYICEFDWIVGELLKTLDQLGVADNTIVILSSDNGPEVESVAHMRADYGHDGARPWRGVKRDDWEGGHRVPFIVRWPGKIKADTTSGQITSLTDVMATLAAVVDAKIPDKAAEDSFNLLPAWLGQDTPPIRPYILEQAFRGEKTLSIRQGDWKYLDHPGSGGNDYRTRDELKRYYIPDNALGAPGQLYDLATDPGETNNLYFKHPEIVKELKTRLDESKKTGRSAPLLQPTE